MEPIFAAERAAGARQAKKARGLNPGRPSKLPAGQRAALAARMTARAETGESVEDIAAAFGISRPTLYRELQRHAAETGQNLTAKGREEMSAQDVARAAALLYKGIDMETVAEGFGVDRATLSRELIKHRAETDTRHPKRTTATP
jgi:DNA invertase Pin-like site-specific DNA recombinase